MAFCTSKVHSARKINLKLALRDSLAGDETQASSSTFRPENTKDVAENENSPRNQQLFP